MSRFRWSEVRALGQGSEFVGRGLERIQRHQQNHHSSANQNRVQNRFPLPLQQHPLQSPVVVVSSLFSGVFKSVSIRLLVRPAGITRATNIFKYTDLFYVYVLCCFPCPWKGITLRMLSSSKLRIRICPRFTSTPSSTPSPIGPQSRTTNLFLPRTPNCPMAKIPSQFQMR